VCFVKHTLSKQDLRRLGLRPRPNHSFFFIELDLAQPYNWVGYSQHNLVAGLDQRPGWATCTRNGGLIKFKLHNGYVIKNGRVGKEDNLPSL